MYVYLVYMCKYMFVYIYMYVGVHSIYINTHAPV